MSKSKLNVGMEKLLALFSGNAGARADEAGGRIAGAHEGISAVRRVLGERNRLACLAEDELAREKRIRLEIEGVDERRIKAISDSRVAGSNELDPMVNELVSERQRLEMEIADCKKVAEDLRRRAESLEGELDVALRQYKGELGAFLNKLFQDAAREFNDSAELAARTSIECISIQRVMMRFLAGDPSGFEQRIFLPRAEPGNGRTILPIIDSSVREFDTAITDRSEEIIQLMKQVGFAYRFDRTPI